jgi:predicted DNA-binding protein
MRTLEKSVRQSISLPPRIARRVHALAQRKNASTNRVIVDLIESGLNAQEQEKKRFLDLAERLTRSVDAAEQKRLKQELARMTFGE